MTTPPEQPPADQSPAGWPPAPQAGYGYAPAAPTDGMAIAALVLGILGLVGSCGYGIGALISPVALFLGRSSIKRIDASQGQIGGRGLAMAGFVTGIVGTVILILAMLATGALVAARLSGAFVRY